MNTSEQAGAVSVPDSPSIEQRIGNIFDDAPQIPRERQQMRQQPQQQESEASHDEQTDEASPQEGATNDSDADTSGDESTAPQFEEVEYEGEKFQVPPKLKEAIIRQSDYTKKTQELAEQRKLVEHQQGQLRAAQLNQEFQQAIQPQLHEIAQIDTQLSQYDRVNWREIPADERTLHMLEMQRLEKLKATKLSEIEGKKAEHSQKFTEQMTKLQAEAANLLKSRIPNWSEATAKETREWALSNGFTQEEISSIYDPRHAEVLWKAAQYDKARSSAKPSVQQARAAKPSSSNPMPQHVKEQLNFRKTLAKTSPNSPERRQAVEDRIGGLFQKRG